MLKYLRTNSKFINEDFENQLKHANQTEQQMLAMKSLIQNAMESYKSIGVFNQKLAIQLQEFYDQSPKYTTIIKNVNDSMMSAHDDYICLCESIKKFNKQFNEWFNGFNNLRNETKSYEQKSKAFEHYRLKVAKLQKQVQERKSKHILETEKQIMKLTRNEVKLKNVQYDYEKMTANSSKLIQTIMSQRFDLVNPLIGQFLEQQSALYNKLRNETLDFCDIKATLCELTQGKEHANANEKAKIIKQQQPLQPFFNSSSLSESPNSQKAVFDNWGNNFSNNMKQKIDSKPEEKLFHDIKMLIKNESLKENNQLSIQDDNKQIFSKDNMFSTNYLMEMASSGGLDEAQKKSQNLTKNTLHDNELSKTLFDEAGQGISNIILNESEIIDQKIDQKQQTFENPQKEVIDNKKQAQIIDLMDYVEPSQSPVHESKQEEQHYQHNDNINLDINFNDYK